MLINCRSPDIEFTCDSDKNVVFEKLFEQVKTIGVSEEGCNNYYANVTADCSNLNKCKDCENGEDIHQTPVCYPKRYQVYKLKNYE